MSTGWDRRWRELEWVGGCGSDKSNTSSVNYSEGLRDGDHGLGPRGGRGRCREEACGGMGWEESGDGVAAVMAGLGLRRGLISGHRRRWQERDSGVLGARCCDSGLDRNTNWLGMGSGRLVLMSSYGCKGNRRHRRLVNWASTAALDEDGAEWAGARCDADSGCALSGGDEKWQSARCWSTEELSRRRSVRRGRAESGVGEERRQQR
ncbi:hypothetical protein M0R45_016083 [Rubus argutus]|uniref:Uncharacterized protein n=1 Tax=Rubus argutus TaxID=59490 RepID=A0AAW1XRG6_RUBAR